MLRMTMPRSFGFVRRRRVSMVDDPWLAKVNFKEM
jgi:hypothetical protein